MLAAIALVSCAATTRHTATAATRLELEGRIHQLLTAYASNDQDAVVRMADPAGFVMYGSDVSEVIRNTKDLRQMMTDDFALWGSAAFGKIQDVDLRIQGHLATAFFDVPFSAGGQPPISVRFSTVWRRNDHQWVLTQSANAVPTVGSSAREILLRR